MNSYTNTALIVLAGGTNRFAEQYGANSKVLLLINGKSLGARTVSACLHAREFSQRIIVGNLPDDLPEKFDWNFAPDSKSMLGNIQAGINAIADRTNSVLLTTSDLPWLSEAAVNDFVINAAKLTQNEDIDIVFPFNELFVCTNKFPGLKRTAVRFQNLRVTGGNLCYAKNVDCMITLAAKLQPIIAARKNVFKLAACFGLKFIFQMIFGKLSIQNVCDRAFDLTGLRFFAYNSPYPEIGSDVDNERSYLYALRWFETRP